MLYSLPPLITGRPAVIVSPLLSLMRDQTAKFNSLGSLSSVGGSLPASNSLAGSLGGLSTAAEEADCKAGRRLLVYLTPERLSYAIDDVIRLHKSTQGGLSLIAIDEAHCVSEWGHDFRPSYRGLGALRDSPDLEGVPICALTATATANVRTDIVKSLGLRAPVVINQSIDRPNLLLKVDKRSRDGYRGDLRPLLDAVKRDPSNQATIIYCSSKALVNKVCEWINQSSSSSSSSLQQLAGRYHADLGNDEREESHMNFLTSKVPIIVATSAFGMGIDKPDTRRVIHLNPPKTVEEYYQQIGRAGRDGNTAWCDMFYSQSDFDQYGGDFYLGNFTDAGAKKNVQASTKSLNSYADEGFKCRRRMLVEYFGERSIFKGDRCGTCDNCKQQKYATAQFRDFTPHAAVIFEAVRGLKEPPWGTIQKVIGGKEVEGYRYGFGINPQALAASVSRLRGFVTPSSTNTMVWYKEELMPQLVKEGYLARSSKTMKTGGSGRSSTWSTYSVTSKAGEGKVMLTPWKSLLKAEEEEAAKKAATKAKMKSKLVSMGMKESDISEEELESGRGPNLDAVLDWSRVLERSADEEARSRLKSLELSVKDWRLSTADIYKIAPANVASDSLVFRICYVAKGLKAQELREDHFREVGVRSGSSSLVGVLNEWITKFGVKEPTDKGDAGGGGGRGLRISETFKPVPWELAKIGKFVEPRLELWNAGKSAESIAMTNQPKPIQKKTVIANLMDAFVGGLDVNLHRLMKEQGGSKEMLPNENEWKALEKCAGEASVDVVAEACTATDLLAKMPGMEFMDKENVASFVEFKERTQEQRNASSYWFEKCKWYLLLKRTRADDAISWESDVGEKRKAIDG